jgi:uncharacterized protein YxjI
VNITVEQRKLSLRSEYDVFGAGFHYHAEKKLFSLLDKIRLLTADDRLLAKIRSHLYLFRPRYDFELSSGEVYRLRCEKLWSGVFVCEGDKDSFRLYRHKKLNYSIFQNDRQIAAFTKSRVKIGKGDRYDIRMDEDANAVVVICLALTVDATENEDDRATITFDFGNIGAEDKPFDESWEPR